MIIINSKQELMYYIKKIYEEAMLNEKLILENEIIRKAIRKVKKELLNSLKNDKRTLKTEEWILAMHDYTNKWFYGAFKEFASKKVKDENELNEMCEKWFYLLRDVKWNVLAAINGKNPYKK